jgi:hypothetical protein
MDNNFTLRLSVRIINLIFAIVILATEALLHILWYHFVILKKTKNERIVLPLNKLERLLLRIYNYTKDDETTAIKKLCESDFVEFCQVMGYKTEGNPLFQIISFSNRTFLLHPIWLHPRYHIPSPILIP